RRPWGRCSSAGSARSRRRRAASACTGAPTASAPWAARSTPPATAPERAPASTCCCRRRPARARKAARKPPERHLGFGVRRRKAAHHRHLFCRRDGLACRKRSGGGTAMASRAAQHKSELIERVKGLTATRLPAGRAVALSEFVSQFYANVAMDDLASESPDNLYAAALSLWSFAAQRPAGAAKVRVYNPRLDEQGWHSSHTVVEMVNDDMPFLVDSLTAALNQRDLTVYLVIHPIVRVLRDRAGNRANSGKGEEIVESQMQI